MLAEAILGFLILDRWSGQKYNFRCRGHKKNKNLEGNMLILKELGTSTSPKAQP
jgi:hypothetical protein